jgi:hypothetical protein
MLALTDPKICAIVNISAEHGTKIILRKNAGEGESPG